jgi:hypothetical protein
VFCVIYIKIGLDEHTSFLAFSYVMLNVECTCDQSMIECICDQSMIECICDQNTRYVTCILIILLACADDFYCIIN